MYNWQRAWQTCDCKPMQIWQDCYSAFVETNFLFYLICSEIFVRCSIFTRFVTYAVILCAVQVFAMWFSLLLLDVFAELLLHAKIWLISRTFYRMLQLNCRKCSNFLHVQVETKWRIWCNTVLKQCCCYIQPTHYHHMLKHTVSVSQTHS